MVDLGPDTRQPPIHSWGEKGASDREWLLREMLPPAVFLHYGEVSKWSEAQRQWRGRSIAGYLAERGDEGTFPGSKPGRAATYFTTLAEALAILAHQPGGVTAFGLHFEVRDQ